MALINTDSQGGWWKGEGRESSAYPHLSQWWDQNVSQLSLFFPITSGYNPKLVKEKILLIIQGLKIICSILPPYKMNFCVTNRVKASLLCMR